MTRSWEVIPLAVCGACLDHVGGLRPFRAVALAVEATWPVADGWLVHPSWPEPHARWWFDEAGYRHPVEDEESELGYYESTCDTCQAGPGPRFAARAERFA